MAASRTLASSRMVAASGLPSISGGGVRPKWSSRVGPISIVVVRLRRRAPATPARGSQTKKGMCAVSLYHGMRTLPHQSCSAEQEAVIGHHEQHGVSPHVVGVHEVQHRAEIVVALRQQRGVLIAKVFHRVRVFRHALVLGPVEMRPVPIIVVTVLPLLEREERLVRIEGFRFAGTNCPRPSSFPGTRGRRRRCAPAASVSPPACICG